MVSSGFRAAGGSLSSCLVRRHPVSAPLLLSARRNPAFDEGPEGVRLRVRWTGAEINAALLCSGMPALGWGRYDAGMETWERGLKVRHARAVQRELLYAAAVEALRAVERDDWLTWSGLADVLNARGVTNHLGRLWSCLLYTSRCV